MTPLGYLTANSLRHYPFKEDCSMESTLGFVLPDNILSDGLFVLKNPLAARVSLTQFTRQYESGIVTTRFSFSVYQSDYTLISSVTIVISDEVDLFQDAEEEFDDLYIKLVSGPGFNTMIPAFSYDFDPTIPAAEVTGGAIVLPMPKVTDIHFQNFVDDVPVEVTVVTLGDLQIQAGANIILDDVNNDMEITVQAGAGTGLYDDCLVIEGIKKINNIGPNDNGDFTLHGGNCFDFDRITHGLQLDHLCDPRCTIEQIDAYAHYINRVKDGIIRVGELGSAAYLSLVGQMGAYASNLATSQHTQALFIEVADAQTRNTQKLYDSFAVGVYNPNRNASSGVISTTLTVTPESGAGFVYVDNTAYIKETDAVLKLPGMGYDNISVPCASMIEHGFVLYNTNLLLANRHVEFFLTQNFDLNNSTAYKMQVVYPTSIYFNIKYQKVWVGTQFTYKFTIDMFDKDISVGDTVRITDLHISLGTGLTVLDATLNLNDTKTPVTPTDTQHVDLSSISIDYVHKAELTFNATSNAGSFACSAIVSSSLPSASFFRTFTVA